MQQFYKQFSKQWSFYKFKLNCVLWGIWVQPYTTNSEHVHYDECFSASIKKQK